MRLEVTKSRRLWGMRFESVGLGVFGGKAHWGEFRLRMEKKQALDCAGGVFTWWGCADGGGKRRSPSGVGLAGCNWRLVYLTRPIGNSLIIHTAGSGASVLVSAIAASAILLAGIIALVETIHAPELVTIGAAMVRTGAGVLELALAGRDWLMASVACSGVEVRAHGWPPLALLMAVLPLEWRSD